jgi:hypothetical protein
VLTDAEFLEMAGEPMTDELWAIVSQDSGELDPDAGQALGNVVEEAASVTG